MRSLDFSIDLNLLAALWPWEALALEEFVEFLLPLNRYM
jgi:hypothetical protein